MLGHLWRRIKGTKLWQSFVTETVETAERERQEADRLDTGAADRRTITVCVVVAVNLALLWYFGLSSQIGVVARVLRFVGAEAAAVRWETEVMLGENARLHGLLYWASACVILYLVIPVAIIKLYFRQRLSDYGLGLKGALKHVPVYIVLFAIVLPCVYIASLNEVFREQYPFYQGRGNEIPPGFLAFELAYAAQFFALEFFFRGFMLHGTKHRFGAYAIFVMVVPYCMIHFGKPFPETIGAIIAGIALGLLSLKTRSIWLGFMIHVSVAWTMDFMALWQRGLL